MSEIREPSLEELVNPSAKKSVMRARDWRALLLMLMPAVICLWLVDYRPFERYGFMPRIAVAFCFLWVMGVCLYYAGVRALLNRRALFLLGMDALIAVSISLHADFTAWISALIIVLTLPYAACDLFINRSFERETPGAYLRAGLRFVGGAFRHLPLPFRSLFTSINGARKASGAVLAGLIILIPVGAVVLMLLSGADMVFGDLLTRATRNIDTTWLIKLILTIATAALLFGGLYALSQPSERRQKADLAASVPAVSCAIPVIALNLIYAVFLYVQFRYLFGGRENAAMAGGYAQYARSGFFQLVYVALINLCVFGFAHRVPDKRVLTPALYALLAFTVAILVSAVWRMSLYVGQYGLSMLRLLTLWAMLVIFVSIALAFVKLARPQKRVFPILVIIALTTWLIVACSAPDAVIARYNVNGYLRGRIAQIDTEYLSELSTDAVDALKTLEDSGNADARDAINAIQARETDLWYYRPLFR